MSDIVSDPALGITTIDNIYDKICEYEELYQSHLEARKGKRYRDDVLVFTDNLEENLASKRTYLADLQARQIQTVLC
ncbi:MAG: hypothetical protein LUG26_07755 [Ruminococcus sp.]|nr:hypothetical protein [Ruminococcus sp.]